MIFLDLFPPTNSDFWSIYTKVARHVPWIKICIWHTTRLMTAWQTTSFELTHENKKLISMYQESTLPIDSMTNNHFLHSQTFLAPSKHFNCFTDSQGFHFRFFDASGLVPPPSPWTDASGLSVDASGLVPPPHQVRMGGTGGQPLNYYKMYDIVCTMLNNNGIT